MAGQKILRQLILFVPLATAAAGVACLQWLDSHASYLPTVFFAGALLVTAAMLQQRNLTRQIEKMAAREKHAHQRRETLHNAETELMQTLDINQVTRVLASHLTKSLNADGVALWLSPQFDGLHNSSPTGAEVSETAATEETAAPRPLEESPEARGREWHLVSTRGFEDAAREQLAAWHDAFQNGDWLGEMRGEAASAEIPLSNGVPGMEETPKLREIFGADSVLIAPIRWKSRDIGAILAMRRSANFDRDNAPFLSDLARLSGPALENALLYQVAAARADIDGLTGLLNHRAVQERITQECARSERASHRGTVAPMSIVLMDLTDFKLFNDVYGHAMGDEVLRTVGNCLRRSFRTSDVVARYGGDEFMAILPETETAGAETLCERLVADLDKRPFVAADGSLISIRLTCGIATWPDDGRSATALFESADMRLYNTKATGRPLRRRAVAGAPVLRPLDRMGVTLSRAEMDALWEEMGVFGRMIQSLDARDRYTRQHSEEAMHYTRLIAQEMKLDDATSAAIPHAALLHDVGKIAIPEAILRKPGRLSHEEMALMRRHTEFGTRILHQLPHFELVQQAVRWHHEAFDGSGYPDKLAGGDIPILARVLAVVDCFASMTTERPYRKLFSIDRALAELKNGRGSQFDPEIVDAFVRVIESKLPREARTDSDSAAHSASPEEANAPAKAALLAASRV